MNPLIGWDDIALRLALTLVAGSLIGINRKRGGHVAGLRTTLLVGLAAALSMLQVCQMLPWRGKLSDSYAVLDLMRLPLGILSGMGFIGAGAILRRGGMVTGVTTAATLWFTTVLGLCFGGGQIGLGLAGLGIALITLELLRRFERQLHEERKATLQVIAAADGPAGEDLRTLLARAGLRIVKWTVDWKGPQRERRINCTVRWRGDPADVFPPPVWVELSGMPGVLQVRWSASQEED
jgi:putative Mg2+ transporter-C (MgtC) family protein